MITNCHKNIMGTVSFDGKFAGMRKAQDFIVYPMQDSGEVITIQSDTRIGQIDLATGALVLSAPRSGGCGFIHLQVGPRQRETLPQEEIQTLRQCVKSTGGLLVGGCVKSENTGAMAL